MYLPDPIEQMENAAERWYFDNLAPNGKVKCPDCGEPCDLERMIPSSQPPGGIPICQQCYEAATTIRLPMAVEILEGTGLPFVIRSPESVRELRGLAACDSPDWWGPKMDGEWVLVCVNHDTHERLVGMGTCIHNAIIDLDDGFSKSPSGIRLSIPAEISRTKRDTKCAPQSSALSATPAASSPNSRR